MSMQLQRSLIVITFIAVTLCMFTFITVNHPSQSIYTGSLEEVSNTNTRAFSIRLDDLFIHNVSDRIIENLRNESLICSKVPLHDPSSLTTIYLITPTYKRQEQLPDLTRLSHTLMHVPSIVWLVIEDSPTFTPAVSEILRRSRIKYVHLIAPMPEEQQKKKVKARGVSNRNKGMDWVRENAVNRQGVMYFADDDNTYDLRLFDEIRSIKRLGMWPVGLITNYGVSSPIVKEGVVTGFYDGWVANRRFPVDMAGFGVSVDLLLQKPDAKMPFVPGYEEDGFLKSLGLSREDIEPKADNCTKIYVWHTQTKKNKPPTVINETLYGDTNIKTLYNLII